MVLDEGLDSLVRRDGPVEVEGADVTTPAVDRDSAGCDPRVARGFGDSDVLRPAVWVDLRLDDQDTAVVEVTGHVGDGGADVLETEQVADAAEQAGDRIERTFEVEVAHIAEENVDFRKTLTCTAEHRLADIEAADGEVSLEVEEMRTGPAGDVEQRRSRRATLPDDGRELVCLRRVVPTVCSVHDVEGQRALSRRRPSMEP